MQRICKKFVADFSQLYRCYGHQQFLLAEANVTRQSFWRFASKRIRKFSSRHIPNSIPVPAYVNSKSYGAPSMPEIKSKEEIDNMRPACKLATQILDNVEENIQEGMTTDDIDALVHRMSVENGAYPSPLHYKGFPKSVCTSVNHVACHGIPGSLVLNNGDIINVDVTVFYKGYHGDTSRTFKIGNVDELSANLVEAARICRDVGIEVCHHGAKLADVGEAIYYCARELGFQVIPNFCGHGIGTYFHGPPDIIHVPVDNYGDEKMRAGMTFTVEPIICHGSPAIKVLDDGWTAITIDGSRSAQFEHTVLVTHDGVEILT